MNPILEKHLYLTIPQFIPSTRANELSKVLLQKQLKSGDHQVANAGWLRNEIEFLELLCEKVPSVNEIVGEPVLPTYCYGRAYRKGNVLERHHDKPTCEISLTVNLDCDKIWPIWIANADGEHSVDLKPGDAMMYLGCVADHWRTAFKGKHCEQIFLHYVRSRGEYASYYFDIEHTAVRETPTPTKFTYLEV